MTGSGSIGGKVIEILAKTKLEGKLLNASGHLSEVLFAQNP